MNPANWDDLGGERMVERSYRFTSGGQDQNIL